MTDAKALTQERKKVHGDWRDQAHTASAMRMPLHTHANWTKMDPQQREALDMIITKISRIVAGDPHHADHWDDIAGYALLGKEGHS